MPCTFALPSFLSCYVRGGVIRPPWLRILVPVVVLLSVSGCTLKFPSLAATRNNELNIPGRYDASEPPVPEVAAGLLTLFSDESLNACVEKALKHNPDLKASAARLEESGFEMRKATASLMPALDLSGGASRSRNFTRGTRSIENSYAAGLDAQWELDVWGRIREDIRASARNRDALLSDHASARESLAAQTMQAYFELIASDRLLDLSKRRLTSFEKTYELVKRRYEDGTEDLGDLDLARSDMESSRAELARKSDLRDQSARQLAALTGSYPDAKFSAYSWPTIGRGVEAGLPSALLMKRPDIDAAYQRIRAADSRVQVAHRDLYPRFSLTASGGGQSSTLRDVLDSNFKLWSVAANLSAPLFDGGRRRAELGAANARAKEALANYQSIVINAFREVENALGSELYLVRQEQYHGNALKAARSAEDRIRRNYETGLVEILTLLDTQRRAFNSEESLINTKALRYKNRVALALALGKGL